jgi:hypothetical protein
MGRVMTKQGQKILSCCVTTSMAQDALEVRVDLCINVRYVEIPVMGQKPVKNRGVNETKQHKTMLSSIRKKEKKNGTRSWVRFFKTLWLVERILWEYVLMEGAII